MSVDRLLVDLVAGWTAPADVDGLALALVEVEVDLPVEARADAGDLVSLTPPRGRLGTGFDRPLGRLRATFGTST